MSGSTYGRWQWSIAAEPLAKKPKKSRNRHSHKKNGKRAVYMFDGVGDNGLPPVRKTPKRHSYDDDLIKVIVDGCYGATVAPLIGTDEATLKARRGFWSRERVDLFEQGPPRRYRIGNIYPSAFWAF